MKQEQFVRMNSRITKDQKKFVKSEAKKRGISEGKFHRSIIDYIMNTQKHD